MKIIKSVCGTKALPRKKQNVWCVKITGNAINKKIRDFLYADSNANIYLERKRDLVFSPILDQNARKRKIIGTNIADGSTLHFDSMTDTERFGFKNKQIWRCCNNIIKQHHGYTWKYSKKGVSNEKERVMVAE